MKKSILALFLFLLVAGCYRTNSFRPSEVLPERQALGEQAPFRRVSSAVEYGWRGSRRVGAEMSEGGRLLIGSLRPGLSAADVVAWNVKTKTGEVYRSATHTLVARDERSLYFGKRVGKGEEPLGRINVAAIRDVAVLKGYFLLRTRNGRDFRIGSFQIIDGMLAAYTEKGDRIRISTRAIDLLALPEAVVRSSDGIDYLLWHVERTRADEGNVLRGVDSSGRRLRFMRSQVDEISEEFESIGATAEGVAFIPPRILIQQGRPVTETFQVEQTFRRNSLEEIDQVEVTSLSGWARAIVLPSTLSKRTLCLLPGI